MYDNSFSLYSLRTFFWRRSAITEASGQNADIDEPWGPLVSGCHCPWGALGCERAPDRRHCAAVQLLTVILALGLVLILVISSTGDRMSLCIDQPATNHGAQRHSETKTC